MDISYGRDCICGIIRVVDQQIHRYILLYLHIPSSIPRASSTSVCLEYQNCQYFRAESALCSSLNLRLITD